MPVDASNVPKGFAEYRKREFCNAIKCPVQVELNRHGQGSERYEETRKNCREACRFTAWRFHNWLIDNAYLVVRPENLKK
jgi:hypothetical protein